MNHPTDEEWMSFLYDESDRDDQARWKAHLAGCAECRSRLEAWTTTRSHLDEWPLQPLRRTGRWTPAVARWAAAIALLLSLGFALGKASANRATIENLRAQLEPVLREDLRQDAARAVADAVARNTEAFSNALDAMDARYSQAFLSLKQDIDTVAVLTDASFRQTEQQLTQLADYSVSPETLNLPAKQ